MTVGAYTLQQLAPGSYDLLLDDEIVGSVVRAAANSRNAGTWYAELINDGPDAKQPAPFTMPEHAFDTLAALLTWLGEPVVRHTERVR